MEYIQPSPPPVENQEDENPAPSPLSLLVQACSNLDHVNGSGRKRSISSIADMTEGLTPQRDALSRKIARTLSCSSGSNNLFNNISSTANIKPKKSPIATLNNSHGTASNSIPKSKNFLIVSSIANSPCSSADDGKRSSIGVGSGNLNGLMRPTPAQKSTKLHPMHSGSSTMFLPKHPYPAFDFPPNDSMLPSTPAFLPYAAGCYPHSLFYPYQHHFFKFMEMLNNPASSEIRVPPKTNKSQPNSDVPNNLSKINDTPVNTHRQRLKVLAPPSKQPRCSMIDSNNGKAQTLTLEKCEEYLTTSSTIPHLNNNNNNQKGCSDNLSYCKLFCNPQTSTPPVHTNHSTCGRCQGLDPQTAAAMFYYYLAASQQSHLYEGMNKYLQQHATKSAVPPSFLLPPNYYAQTYRGDLSNSTSLWPPPFLTPNFPLFSPLEKCGPYSSQQPYPFNRAAFDGLFRMSNKEDNINNLCSSVIDKRTRILTSSIESKEKDIKIKSPILGSVFFKNTSNLYPPIDKNVNSINPTHSIDIMTKTNSKSKENISNHQTTQLAPDACFTSKNFVDKDCATMNTNSTSKTKLSCPTVENHTSIFSNQNPFNFQDSVFDFYAKSWIYALNKNNSLTFTNTNNLQ